MYTDELSKSHNNIRLYPYLDKEKLYDWRSIDPELNTFYQKNLIREYKMRYLFEDESAKHKEYSDDENKS